MTVVPRRRRSHLRVGALAVALSLASCGGAPDHPVPDVVGERLDLAKSHVEDAGLEAEPVGGGTFGVVNESNWTVCSQEPAPGTTDIKKVKLIVDRVCSAPTSSGPVSTVAATTASTAAAEAPTTTRARPAVLRMPDVVGLSWADAIDRFERAGFDSAAEVDVRYPSIQGGLLGPVNPWNWGVTEQSPAPGIRVRRGRKVQVTIVRVRGG
jgi:PASTA domain